MNQATKKNLKQFLIVLSLFAAIIAAIAIPLHATRDIRAEKKRLRENQYAKDQVKLDTGITIPDDVEVIYNFSQVGRDSIYYIVFKFNEEPTEWLKDNGFKKTKNEEFESYWIPDSFIKKHIPEQFYPNFNDKYYWFVKGWAHLTYQPDTLELIFFIVEF